MQFKAAILEAENWRVPCLSSRLRYHFVLVGYRHIFLLLRPASIHAMSFFPSYIAKLSTLTRVFSVVYNLFIYMLSSMYWIFGSS